MLLSKKAYIPETKRNPQKGVRIKKRKRTSKHTAMDNGEKTQEARIPTTKYELGKAHSTIDGSRSRYINISATNEETNRIEGREQEREREREREREQGSRWSPLLHGRGRVHQASKLAYTHARSPGPQCYLLGGIKLSKKERAYFA